MRAGLQVISSMEKIPGAIRTPGTSWAMSASGDASRRINRGMRAVGTATKRAAGIIPTRSERATPSPRTEAAQSFSRAISPYSRGQLAKVTSCSKATVKAWKTGDAAPNLAAFVDMYHSLPEVQMWLTDQGASAQNRKSALFSHLLKASVSNDAEGRVAARMLKDMLRGGE